MQIDPAEIININAVMLDAYIFALGQLLEELQIIDGDELTLKFKTKLLENLKLHRANVFPMVKEARLKSKLLLPDNHGKPRLQ